MPWPDFLEVTATAAVITFLIGGIAVVALMALRRSSLTAQVCIMVLAAILSVVVSMILASNMMYLSEHDLTVAVNVAVVSGTVSMLLVSMLGVVIVRNGKSLASAARRIGDGEVLQSTGRHSIAEFTSLADELVSVSEKLAESREREARIETSRRELVAWISHDLRTPLAGIRAMAEALEDSMAEDPQRYYRQMRVQVDQLSSMVDDLFELSKIDSDTLRLTMEDVSLYDIVSDTVADLAPISQGRSITIEAPLGHGLVIKVDPREMARVVRNLLVNAIQHTPDGSPITVRAELVDGRASVSVIDTGGGISEDDLLRVFEPGWRGSSARTPVPVEARSSGAGLGLAIVKGIVSAHHGEVSVRNVPGGARFDVLLPLEPVALTA